MLNNLIVVNGILTPAFNSNTLEYDVYVDEDVISLVLNYEVEDLPVTIYGNDYLSEGDSHVYIEVLDKVVTTYVLNVHKPLSETASKEISDMTKLEVSETYNLDIIAPMIGILCFVAILCLYLLIFKRK